MSVLESAQNLALKPTWIIFKMKKSHSFTQPYYKCIGMFFGAIRKHEIWNFCPQGQIVGVKGQTLKSAFENLNDIWWSSYLYAG